MSAVKYRAIIRDAWTVTQENKRLIWWYGFLPALLTTLVSIGYLSYQAAAIYTSPLFRDVETNHRELWRILLEKALAFYKADPSFMVVLIVLTAIGAVAYLMLPVFTQGAVIQLLARYRNGHSISIREGISFGLRRFLQLFEYHLAIKTFSLVSLFTNAIFIVRSLGPEAIHVFVWLFLLIGIVGLVFTLLFTYSEYYICIDNHGMLQGMLSSCALVIKQWHHTFFMLLLMGIISIRILFNIFVALLIPALVIAPALFFAGITLTHIGIFVGAILGMVALYFTSYFIGIFDVFSTAVWTFTFLELTSVPEESLRS